MVGFLPDGERVVGDRAKALAEHSPENVAFATKRFIGRRWTPELALSAKAVVPYPLIEGPSGEIRIKVAGRTLPLTQVSAMILGELKLDAQAFFGRPVSKAVITVPANFDDAQRTATKEAARIAGLDAIRIINEPTSAAVAYGLTSGFQGRALVFDLGGGTFDVSILEVQSGVFQVKATGGDSQLGGEDFDNRIAQWLLAQVDERFRDAVARDKLSMQRLKTAAEKAKRDLTDAEEAYIAVGDLGDHSSSGGRFTQLDTALTRAFFNTLCEPLSRRCLEVCQQLMTDAKLERGGVEAVLLAGGMTRVPLVRQLVADFFGKEPSGGVNPDEVVSMGAAIHAHEIAARTGQALLLDVVSHSMGVGVLGGKVRKLINKNAPVPISARELFLPSRAGQTQVRIPVYQGESDYADENTKLGEIVLQDLSGRSRADVPIEVTFELTTEGTLSVRATDLTSGLSEAVSIQARTDLSTSEVDRLAREQGSYAAQQKGKDEALTEERFARTLERAEKLARLLERGAEENPSTEAHDAVARARSLVDAGKAAWKSKDFERMAEVTRMLERLGPPA